MHIKSSCILWTSSLCLPTHVSFMVKSNKCFINFLRFKQPNESTNYFNANLILKKILKHETKSYRFYQSVVAPMPSMFKSTSRSAKLGESLSFGSYLKIKRSKNRSKDKLHLWVSPDWKPSLILTRVKRVWRSAKWRWATITTTITFANKHTVVKNWQPLV